MEITIAWFWLVKLGATLVVIYAEYIAFYKHKFKNTLYNIIAAILLILSVVQPFKLEPTTKQVNAQQSIKIEQAKVLPPLVKDESFKNNVVPGISKEDIQ